MKNIADNVLDYLYVAIPIAMIVVGHSLMKIAANIYVTSGEFINIFLIVGYVLFVIRGFIWILILRKVKLAIAYPLLSISYIFILIVSNIFFNEPITKGNIIGTVVIVIGVVMLTGSERKAISNV